MNSIKETSKDTRRYVYATYVGMALHVPTQTMLESIHFGTNLRIASSIFNIELRIVTLVLHWQVNVSTSFIDMYLDDSTFIACPFVVHC